MGKKKNENVLKGVNIIRLPNEENSKGLSEMNLY